MPPHFYTDGEPKPPPPVPAWGTLPLDIYLLEQWETPHATFHTETPSQRRRRLVRQFLDLGIPGREVNINTDLEILQVTSPPHPTQSQIETILAPLRPDSLRRYATWTGSEGLWIRTVYGPESDAAHAELWEEFVEVSQAIGPGSLMFEDEALFGDVGLGGVLEVFPERVTNYGRVGEGERVLRGILGRGEDEDEDEDEGEGEGEEDICRKYWTYHVACVVTHVFVEDGEALRGRGVLHVFLDDCGNVVRAERVDSDAVDNFDGAWAEGSWKDEFIQASPGAVGEAYLPGGVRGPPYLST